MLESILIKITSSIASYIFTKGFLDQYVQKPIQQAQLDSALEKALSNALDVLNNKDLNPTGQGTLDISFLQSQTVIQEICDKLLEPAIDEPINLDLLLDEHLKNWQNADSFTNQGKSQQRRAIHFFIDILIDQLWAESLFRPLLQAKTMRQWDDHISLEKRLYIIKSYLQRECELIQADRKIKMGESTPYIDPLLKTFHKDNEKKDRIPQAFGVEFDQKQKERKEYNLDDVLHLDQKAIIIADSGLGKSTLLQEMFLRLKETWNADSPVPFLFSPTAAQKLNESDYQNVLQNRLFESGIPIRQPQLTTLVADLVSERKIFYLIDALDQMTDPASVIEFFNRQGCASICTSRPTTFEQYQTSMNQALQLELLPFTREGIEKYYGDLLKASQLANFQDDLLGIPMIARMILELLTDGPNGLKNIHTRSQLYFQFIYQFLTRPQDIRLLESANCEPEDVSDLLKVLSYNSLLKNHIGEIPREFVNAQKVERTDLILFLKLQLFNKIFEGDKTFYSFRHRSFQSFFAALVLKDRIEQNGLESITRFIFHPNWEEPIRMLSGMLPTQIFNDFIRMIIQPENWLTDPLDHAIVLIGENLRIASLCAGENDINNSLCTDLCAKLVDQWHTIPYLEFVQHEIAIDYLDEVIQESNVENQKSALIALQKYNSSKAVSTLSNALHFSESDLKRQAALSLGEIGSDDSLDVLVQATASENENIRANAVLSLGVNKKDKHLQLILSMLKDKSDIVKGAAINALGAIKQERLLPYILPFLKNRNKELVDSAIFAVAEINSENAVEYILPGLLNSSDYILLSELRSVFIECPPQRVANNIRKYLSSHKVRIRVFAINLIEEIKLDYMANDVLKCLSDKRAVVRARAAEVLGELDAKFAFEELCKALKDRYAIVREAAAGALQMLKMEQSFTILKDVFFFFKNLQVRERATWAIGELSSNEAVELLSDAALNTALDMEIREAAVLGLSGNKHPRAIKTLIETLNIPDFQFSSREGLERSKDPKAFDAVLDVYLKSGDIDKPYILGTLAHVDPKKSIKILIDALYSKDEDTRQFAAYYLGKIKSTEAIEHLLITANDPIEFVRNYSVSAIREIFYHHRLTTPIQDDYED